MTAATSSLNTEMERAARVFVARVAAEFPVEGAILFGSRARGTQRPSSDADIAVLLHGQTGKFVATKLAMADIAYDVLLETGIRIQPLPIWANEWLDPESHANPELIRNIRRDGIRL